MRRLEAESPGRLDFETADGVRVRPTRFVHLPLAVYRAPPEHRR